MPFLAAILAFCSTLLGGLFTLRFKHRLHAIMAVSAGFLIGVVFLDLLPELGELSASEGIEMHRLMIVLLFGFFAIFLLEKLTVIHGERQHDAPGHRHNVGLAGALGLTFHSLLDGIAIGVSFQAGTEVGILVAAAVLAHDFADGLNTVTFMLATENSRRRTLILLVCDALAPVAGALLTVALPIPASAIAYQLAFFAGFLLYMGAADLLPEVHERPKWGLLLLTIIGTASAGVMVQVLHAIE